MMARASSLILAAASAAACAPPGDLAAQMGAKERPSVVIGARLLQASQAEMALDAFLRLIAEEGVTADALNGVGASYYRMGRPGDARRFFQAAVELDPNNAGARNNFGVALYDDGEYAAALSEFQRAYELTGGLDRKVVTNIGMAEVALAELRDKVQVDEAEFDVIQYGQGFYRLEKRRPDTTPPPAPTTGPAPAVTPDAASPDTKSPVTEAQS